ncbi:Rad52/Rad22 family DNA repair protein [Streptomyces sp. YIM S03343]
MSLTDYQLKTLLAPVNPRRVGQVRGMAHMEAWDIRRQLTRVFGFGGYSIDTLSLDLVTERETKNGDRSRWTVVYRAQVRLTVYGQDGAELSHWEDGAAGDSVNQPSLGDAHDMAMKTALSQAMKRCAVNLGDQFGLSLYNNGSPAPVVQWSAAHPPKEADSSEAPPLDQDPQVQPEPTAPTPAAVPEPTATPPAEAPNGAQDSRVDERQAALDEMKSAAHAIDFDAGLAAQFESTFGHSIEQGTAAEFREATDLMRGNAAA